MNHKHKQFLIEYQKSWNATGAYLKVYPNSSYDAARAHATRLLLRLDVKAELMDRLSFSTELSNKEMKERIIDAVEGYSTVFKRRKQKSTCVYIIKSDNDLFKVGVAFDVYSRLQTLDTASPVGLILWAVLESTDAARIEKTIHAQLNEFRVKGEWFRLSPEQLEALVVDYGFVKQAKSIH